MPLTITPLPVPVPSSTDPGNFSARGDATFGAFPTLITETNALASEQATNRDIVIQNRIDTETAQANAANFALAASVSEANSLASSTAQLWVSGTTYSIGTVVYSPITASTYRRKITGAGTTDPSADSTNWYPVVLDASTNWPAILPSLNLDFANSGKLDPRITFTRASTATYFDKLGVLRTAADNEPRFDYDPVTLEAKGLLIEESRQNLVRWNRDLINVAWVKTGCSVLKNQVGLDGTIEACTIGATADNATILQTISSASAARITSAYLKRLSGVGTIQMTQNNGATWTDITSSVGSNWSRVEIPSATIANPIIGFRIVSNSDSIAVDFVQHELGAFSTSPIATTSTAVTRQADQASMTGTNFSSWYRQDEGTLYEEGSTLKRNTDPDPKFTSSITDGLSNFIMGIRYTIAVSPRVDYAGVTQASIITLNPYQNDAFHKNAIAVKQNDFAASTNGLAAVVDSSGSLPMTMNTLSIGTYGTVYLCGHIKKIAYYPKRLTNQELQAITS